MKNIYDSVDLVLKTLPKVSVVTKYSVYKKSYYYILIFLFYKTFGRLLFQQSHLLEQNFSQIIFQNAICSISPTSNP